MTRSLLFVSASSLALCLGHGAAAQVSAQDIWANYQSYLNAFGADTTGTLSQSGNVTTVSDFEALFALPMGFGTIGLEMSAFAFVENGDGTVTVAYPNDTKMLMRFAVPDQIVGSVEMLLTGGVIEMTASGNPGDVTYAYEIPEYSLELTNFDVEGPALATADMGMLRALELAGTVIIKGTSGEVQVSEGDLITIEIEADYSSVGYDFTFESPVGIGGAFSGATGASETSGSLTLPAGGVSVMALAQALRDGMAAEMSTTTESSESYQEVTLEGAVVTYTRDTTGPVETALGFGVDGLRLSGQMQDYVFDTLEAEIPVPIRGTFAEALFDMRLPLMGSDAPQDVELAMSVNGLTMDDSLWDIFDSARKISREPAGFALDLTARIGTAIDLLDIPALMALGQGEDVPFSLHALDIGEVSLSAAGAAIQSSGGFTFDMMDLVTFGGLPAPTGSLDISIEGSDALLNTLIDAGLLPAQEAMGARMALGLFATPGEREDTVTSKIEIDGATGAISANGQRLQ